jgi:predicted DNA-binding transcriptional regulator AlpA
MDDEEHKTTRIYNMSDISHLLGWPRETVGRWYRTGKLPKPAHRTSDKGFPYWSHNQAKQIRQMFRDGEL